MLNHNGDYFTTTDRDNDRSDMNCADGNNGGWWYDGCQAVNPNNKYGNEDAKADACIYWGQFKDSACLKYIEMKLRPRSHGHS